MSKNIQSYEFADRRKALLFVLGGLALIFLPGIMRSILASPALVALLVSVLGLAPIFIAIAENYGYIGVLADYLYDKTGNAVLTSLVAPIPAVAMHAALPLLVPGYSLLILYIFFAYWTFASIQSRSTLPADILHVLNNCLALIL
ncbi:MAG TPA: CPBP family intramembrane metalloprotease [Pyrodictiaceae archaeon]|nr:CPBP family intramembrane metalloprotease [Pyrodictiaceae archaeon]